MKWFLGFFAGIFLLAPMAGWGTDWQFYAKGDAYDLFYDADSITRPDKDHVRVWIKLVGDEELIKRNFAAVEKKPLDEDIFSYQKILTEVNCSERKQRNLTVNNYSKIGKYLSSPPASTLGQWQMIVPGSFGDTLHNKICK